MFTRKNAVMSLTSALVVLSLTSWMPGAHAEAGMKPGKVFKAGKKPEAKPSLPQGYVSQGGLTWMPVTFYKKWAEANSYCANTAINGQSGWRLPTKDELSALHASGAMNGQGWTLGNTWSSTPDGSGDHYVVGLDDGGVGSVNDTLSYYVTCVR